LIREQEETLDDQTLQLIKNDLDTALQGRRPQTAIAFGSDLFAAFHKKAWITLEQFNLGGLGFEDPIAVYCKTHFAIILGEVPETEYRIGADPGAI
jgi:hypothetical protein